jgi:uncharacterized protein YjdB
MRTSRSRVPTRNFARQLFIAAAVALCSAAIGCTDAGNLTSAGVAGGRSGAMKFAVVPHFHVFGAVSNQAPINLAHLTVLSAATRDTIASTVTIPLDPSSPQWQLPVDFTLPEDATAGSIIVIVELLNVTDGVATIEWSGETPPISVTPGAPTPPPAPIELVQGPPDNLTVASVKIAPVTESVMEGETLQLHAVTVGSGTPLVFWAPVDPTHATVSPTGQVSLLLPGPARVIASAGIRSDTITLQVRQRPSSVQVVPALAFTSIGAELSLSARVLDARGAEIVGEPVLFVVDNPAILDQTGPASFRARMQGITSIFASAASLPAVRAIVAASVFQVAAGITLSNNAIEFHSIGATDAVVASATDAGGATIPGAVVQWHSENPAVADVAPDGTITARGPGSTGIVATLQSASARVAVSVNQTVATLSVTPATALIEGLTGTAALTPVAHDPGGSLIAAPTLAWTSSAPAIASVNAAGVVTAVANGTATITATAPGGVNASSVITVRQRVASIVPTPPNATMQSIGETLRVVIETRDPSGRTVPLTFTTFTWSTDAAAVATVDATGLITARGNGTATITVRAASGATATIPVTVVQHAATIAVTPATSRLRNPGETVQLSASATDAMGNVVSAPVAYTWTSSDEAVASVDESGNVTAHHSGSVTISAAAGTVTGTASVVVELTVASVQVTPSSFEFTSADATVFSAVARDALGQPIDGVSFTWTSSNPTVVSVDMSGTAFPAHNGTAELTAMAPNGVTGSATVTVSNVSQPSLGTDIIPGSAPVVENCIPFGNNTSYQFAGFIYRNIPAFHMNVGDRIAFDLGAVNDVDLRRNVFFAVLNKNPGPPGGSGGDVPSQDVRALAWTKVVSETHVPDHPRGNSVVGDYELVYTAEAEFDFPGGGFAIGFQAAPPATFADNGCEQVLAGTGSQDASGLFYSRFFGREDLTLGTLDLPGGNTGVAIGGVRIYGMDSAPRQILRPSALRSGLVPVKPKNAPRAAGDGRGPLPMPASGKPDGGR